MEASFLKLFIEELANYELVSCHQTQSLQFVSWNSDTLLRQKPCISSCLLKEGLGQLAQPIAMLLNM
jgi:hypothetical protein